jgi:8-oxo-dGTP pyrophosphatase MutT (NUDIX family)
MGGCTVPFMFGSDGFFYVSCFLLFFKRLSLLRKDNSCWGYAGGAVEPNEPVEEAAKRELYEETGLIANKLELFGVFSGPDLHYIYPNGDEVSNVDIVYLCKDYSGELKCQDSEVSDLRFFPLDRLPENLSPPVRKAILRFAEEFLTRNK